MIEDFKQSRLQKEKPELITEKPEINIEDKKWTDVIRRLNIDYNVPADQAETFIYYWYNLGLDFSELVGKKVLDVGSGPGNFKEVLKKINTEIKFVNLDDGLIWKGVMDVQGKAEALPFKDESFDLVIAHCSVPVMQATSGKDSLVPETVREMVRVVKRGGVVKIFPARIDDSTMVEMAGKYEKLKRGVVVGLEGLENISTRIIRLRQSENVFSDRVEIFRG